MRLHKVANRASLTLMPARRRIPPIPVEDLFDNPRRLALPSAGRNAVDELCWQFWKTECRSFPLDYDTVFGIVRAHRPTFSRYQAEILAIFAELKPQLERAWQARLTSHATLRAWTAARDAKRRHMKATGRQTPTPVIALTPKHGQQRKERLAQGDKSFYAPSTPRQADKDMFRDS